MTEHTSSENILVIRRSEESAHIEIEAREPCEFQLTKSYRDDENDYIAGTVVVKIPRSKS